jgi:hypothetical protein
MSDILADYREWRDQQAARVSTHSGGCHMWHRDCMIHRLAAALERATLTDAERECLEWAEEIAGNCEEFDRVPTLRGLLEKLGGER